MSKTVHSISETGRTGNEAWLNSMGFSMACASISFAAYMIIAAPEQSQLRIGEATAQLIDPLNRSNSAPRDWELATPGNTDTIITASLSKPTGYGSLNEGIGDIIIDGKMATQGRTYGYVLHKVKKDTATVETRNQLGNQLWQVRRGSLLPGAGRVQSIKRVDGRWQVLTTLNK